MNWIQINEKRPAVNESVMLAINYGRSKRFRFWKKKIIVFGWLMQIKETSAGIEYLFYDQTNHCHRKHSVTHWMTLPEPPKKPD